MDKSILSNPSVEVMGKKTPAFKQMYERIKQLDGLLAILQYAHVDADESDLEYTLQLAANTAVEIRELAAMIDDSAPPRDEVSPMRNSYRQTVEAAEALIEATNINELKHLPEAKQEAITDAIFEMEGNIGAARDDFLGAKEVRS